MVIAICFFSYPLKDRKLTDISRQSCHPVENILCRLIRKMTMPTLSVQSYKCIVEYLVADPRFHPGGGTNPWGGRASTYDYAKFLSRTT